MRISINHQRIVEQLQCDLAPKESDKEGPKHSSDRHHCNCGYGCDTSCYFDGHSDPQEKGYDILREGQVKIKNRPKFRHDKSRRGL